MLWYKSWLETRWRFLIGLVLVIALGLWHRADIPEVQAILQSTQVDHGGGILGRQIAEAMRCHATIAATSGRSGFARTCRSN